MVFLVDVVVVVVRTGSSLNKGEIEIITPACCAFAWDRTSLIMIQS